MTVTLKSVKIKGFYIEVIQEKFSPCYMVRMFREVGGLYGYPIKENTYTTEQKAIKRFNRLKKEATA